MSQGVFCRELYILGKVLADDFGLEINDDNVRYTELRLTLVIELSG